jgi:hypothetical protein
MTKQQTTHADPAGFSIESWCKSVEVSRAWYYLLTPEDRPASVQILKRRIITESPQAWLQRMRAKQKVAIPEAA